jgi:GMP reductase
MLSTVNEKICQDLSSNGYFYIYHRFNNDTVQFIENMNKLGLITSISLGVKPDSYKIIDTIKERNLKVDYITIDIAHGHSTLLEKIVKYIRDTLSQDIFIIGGNVCTTEAVHDLEKWGCSATKVGIGPGSACTTFHSTHFGSRGWQASCVYEISRIAEKPIICDGGIRTVGHIAAALALGSSMVMVGGMLAGFEDSPGDVITLDGKQYKEFFGSASEFTKGHKKYVEGRKNLVEYKHGTLRNYYTNTIEQGLKSAISYSGGTTAGDLQFVKFVKIRS